MGKYNGCISDLDNAPDYVQTYSLLCHCTVCDENEADVVATVEARIIELPPLYQCRDPKPYAPYRALDINNHIFNFERYGFEELYEPFIFVESTSCKPGYTSALGDLFYNLPHICSEIYGSDIKVVFFSDNCFEGRCPYALKASSLKCPNHIWALRIRL